MGIVLGPVILFHLGLFLLGISVNGYKTVGIVNKIKFIPISLLIAFLASYSFVYKSISFYENMRIYAFDIMFDVIFSWPILLCLFISLIA